MLGEKETMTVGEDIATIIVTMEKLYKETGLEYFKNQAMSWSQWVWMLQESKRKEWGLLYQGDPNGEDVCRGPEVAPKPCDWMSWQCAGTLRFSTANATPQLKKEFEKRKAFIDLRFKEIQRSSAVGQASVAQQTGRNPLQSIVRVLYFKKNSEAQALAGPS